MFSLFVIPDADKGSTDPFVLLARCSLDEAGSLSLVSAKARAVAGKD